MGSPSGRVLPPSLPALKAHLAKATQTDEAWQAPLHHPSPTAEGDQLCQLSQLLYFNTPLLPLISKLLFPQGSVILATEVCGPYSPLSFWALQTLLLTCNPAQGVICHRRLWSNTSENWAGSCHPGDVLSDPGSSGRAQ